MVQMTFKLNCKLEAGRFKNGVRNEISSKIERQMGAAIKMLLLYLRATMGRLATNWHIVTPSTTRMFQLFYTLCAPLNMISLMRYSVFNHKQMTFGPINFHKIVNLPLLPRFCYIGTARNIFLIFPFIQIFKIFY